MAAHDVALAVLAREQHGLLTTRQARAAGMTRRAIEGRVASGLLVAVHRGVYRHAATAETRATELMAAVLACGEGALASHRSAGRVWQLREVPRWRPEVTVPRTGRPTATGIVIHRTGTLEAPDVARRHGIPVTTVARTLLDLGAILPPPVLAVTTEDACIRHLVSPPDLVATLERLAKPGRRGARALRTVVGQLVPPADLDSRLEHDLLLLIRAAGAPPPVAHHEITLVGGRRAEFDFAWPPLRIAVEADGRRWHATSADFQSDLARHNAVTATGWRLYRFGWADVHQRPESTIRTLSAVFRAARAGAA